MRPRSADNPQTMPMQRARNNLKIISIRQARVLPDRVTFLAISTPKGVFASTAACKRLSMWGFILGESKKNPILSIKINDLLPPGGSLNLM